MESTTILAIFTLFIAGYSAYLQRRQLQRKRPFYLIKTEELFTLKTNEKLGGLSIKFGEETVDEVYRTIILIWNGGNYTLEPKDIIKDEVFLLEFKDNPEFYSVGVKKESSKKVKGQVLIHKDGIGFNFDYLPPNEGVSYRILHPKLNNQKFKVSGQLFDGTNIKEAIDINGMVTFKFGNMLHVSVSIKLLSIVCIITGIMIVWSSIPYNLNLWNSIIDLIFGIIIIISGILVFLMKRPPNKIAHLMR